ncbi:hypothetical protein AZH43_02765 [Acinetobacter pragensis]|uniref:Uncharacterized protein n=1 Tax=Acinetobacter pragensis TaxID=1806892 RepID=A0A151XZ51_9GAMM|nr:hypothetical protein AZH43_02765 [Acinetobacter pragensis]
MPAFSYRRKFICAISQLSCIIHTAQSASTKKLHIVFMQLHLPVLNQMLIQRISDLISHLTNYNTLIFIVSKIYDNAKSSIFNILVLFKRNPFY